MKKRLAVAEKTSDEKVPLGEQERENLIACVTGVLKEESDQVLEGIVEVVKDLSQNAGMRESFVNFPKNGWAFIQKTGKSENEFELVKTTLLSAMQHGKPKSYSLASQSRLDHETHPLQNELIVKKIFELFSLSDLKNCRLVSTKWRDFSLTSWRGKAVLQVNRIVNRNYRDEEKFFRDGSEFLEVPFKSYKLSYDPHLLGFDTKKKLLETYSLSIQYLHLSSKDVKTMFSVLTMLPELRDVTLEFCIEDLWIDYESITSRGGKCPFQDLQPATSKLRRLDLNLCFVFDVDFEPKFRFPWKEVFKSVPFIESLCVKYKFDKGYRDRSIDLHVITFEDIMRTLCEVRKDGNLPTLNLKELDIVDTQQHPLRTCLTERIVGYLIEAHLPLQTLCITISASVNSSTIAELLSTYAETLLNLKCIGDRSRNYMDENVLLKLSLPPHLPSKVLLPNLKELVFVGSCVWAFHVLGSLDLPNLQILKIEQKKPLLYQTEMDQQFDQQRITLLSGQSSGASSFLPNLKTFFYNGSRSFSAVELQCLGRAMPNVTDLGIPFCDIKTFPIVCELWPSLQSLHVFLSDRTFPEFDDYVITGLSSTGKESRKPNIANLKDLRKFVLETRLVRNFPLPRRPLISGLSAKYGFLKLPKLRILHMETLCEFPPRIQAALESHLLEMKVKCPETVDVGRVDDSIQRTSAI